MNVSRTALRGAGARSPAAASPLIPPDSVASRALVVVIAIMTFLACLTAGAALLVERASASWRTDVSREVTIQFRPPPNGDADALAAQIVAAARKAPGVEDARAVSTSETERMLEPWLGRGVDISRLPVPRLVIARLQKSQSLDLAPLRAAVAGVAPAVSVDDHAMWLARLATVASIVVTLTGAIFVLVIVAMTTAIGFATRGAVASSREVIEVLHLVGASDHFVARQFQAHFMALGFRGVAVGGGAAAIFFLSATLLSQWWAVSPGGAEVAALFGAFSLRVLDFLVLLVISVGIAALTGYISRWIVYRYLVVLL